MPPSIARRLASYSLATGVALAGAPGADAQVVTMDLDPDAVLSPGDNLSLDLDGDGAVDLEVSLFTAATETQARFYMEGLNGNGVLGVDAPVNQNASFGSAFRLDAGESVGPSGQFFQFGVLGSVYSSQTYYRFVGAEGFVGFRFVGGDGETRYGWARVAGNETVTEGVVFELAYESTPDTPIAAGATTGGPPTDLAAGPDGGAVSSLAPNPARHRATLRVTPPEAGPVRVEVFDALGRSVAVLHDGPLAGGATASFTLDAATLPAGIYVVQVAGPAVQATRVVTIAR